VRHVAISLFLLASAADAEDWVRVGEIDAAGKPVVVDVSEIADVDSSKSALFKFVYSADRVIGDNYEKSAPTATVYRSELRRAYFHCSERTMAIVQSTLRDAEENVVGHFDIEPARLSFREAAAGTVGEIMLGIACGSTHDPEKATSKSDVSQRRISAGIAVPANPDDYYPSGSNRRKEKGTPTIEVCVGPTGKLLREPVVTDSSGFPDLDGAAIKVAKATRYAPAKENGVALPESCLRYKIKFLPKFPGQR
jgi:TonB family protein